MPFRDILGHRPVLGLLARAIARGTVPPTLLFDGPSGVGKWQVAQAVAAAVNCLSPQAGGPEEVVLDACGVCRSCDRIARGMHVDVLGLEPDERASIKIDPVRAVLERCNFRPFEGTRRFVLIRDADALETPAQNALLKSLEEPPDSTVFILVTSVAGLLLQTVRSRCMRLRFGRLTEDDVALVLARDHEMEPGTARAAAALADGSVARALAQSSEELAEVRHTAQAFLAQVVGSDDVRQKLDVAKLLTGAKPERTREEMAVVLRAAQSMLRDLEVLHAGADPQVLANPDLHDSLVRLTRTAGGERARRAFAAVDRALMALGRNAGTKVVAEWLAVHI
jgi:DNA polymerase III subunit delta'